MFADVVVSGGIVGILVLILLLLAIVYLVRRI